MRSFLKIVSAAGLAMALATSAQAAPFTGSVSYSLGGLAPLVATGSGSGNSPGGVTIATASWAQTGPLTLTLAATAAPPLTAIRIALTAPGPCSALPGSCPLGGTANALVAGANFLTVPLSGIGVNGRQSFGPYGSYIDAQPWQTGVVPITVNGVTLTTGNGALSVTTGYDNRNAAGAGLVKLVAPAGLMSGLAGNLPLFVSMELNFVPEPGGLLLMGSGIATLVLLGARRMRS
jgi:hypothetical protein